MEIEEMIKFIKKENLTSPKSNIIVLEKRDFLKRLRKKFKEEKE